MSIASEIKELIYDMMKIPLDLEPCLVLLCCDRAADVWTGMDCSLLLQMSSLACHSSTQSETGADHCY